MYCKYFSQENEVTGYKVLIVAKCIVNMTEKSVKRMLKKVLIVAKCIVNMTENSVKRMLKKVLIVAKCIVN